MNKNAICYLTITASIGIVSLCLILMLSLFQNTESGFLIPNEIKGSAIEHEGLLYTLNFKQQNSVIFIINAAEPLEKSDQPKAPGFPAFFTKLIFYRFQMPNIEIIPHGYEEENLIFSTSLWNNKLMREKSNGKLKKILDESYDL